MDTNLISVDSLKMYFGDDFAVNDKIVIHQPTIGEVADYGEQGYFSMAHLICSIPSDMKSQLWDMKIDWMEISDFQLFTLLCKTLPPERTSILFGDLDFTALKLYPHPQNEDMVVLANKETGVIIDEYIYMKMVEYIRKMHGFTKKVERAKNKMTKKILIQEDRDRIARNANKEFESYLLPLISSVQARTHYTKEYIRNMGLCEFMDQVSRLQIIVSADALLHGMYGGFIDTKKINKKELNWMREITQNESDGMVINEGSQSVGSN